MIRTAAREGGADKQPRSTAPSAAVATSAAPRVARSAELAGKTVFARRLLATCASMPCRACLAG
jgi:hypothetical protein